MRKQQRNIPALSLAFLVILLLLFDGYVFFVRRGVGPAYYIEKFFGQPKDDVLNLDIYKDLTEEYHHLNRQYSDELSAVFVGDSITKRFNILEFTDSDSILNRGIFSDTTLGLLKRMDNNVGNLKVDKLFIMIGYNDIQLEISDDLILENIKGILGRSNAERTYLQSILPVSADRIEVNDRIARINDQLKMLGKGSGCVYVDLHSRFKGDGNCVNPELTRDGVHPNYFGYRLWYSIIEPLL